MYINYQESIKETPKEVLKLEQKEKNAVVLKRLQLLRLLRSGQARSMEEAAGIVGISTVQARRIWRDYKRYGLEIYLICLKPGRKSRLRLSSAESNIRSRVTNGYFRTLKEVQQFILKKYNVAYTQAGVWHLLYTFNLQLVPKRAKPGYKAKVQS